MDGRVITKKEHLSLLLYPMRHERSPEKAGSGSSFYQVILCICRCLSNLVITLFLILEICIWIFSIELFRRPSLCYDPFLKTVIGNRGGGAYGDRGYIEGSFLPREAGPPYSRGVYPGETGLDVDIYPRHGWPPGRRRSLEEEIALQRGSHRLEKLNQGRETYQRSKREFSLERTGRDVGLERESSREIGLERISSRTGSRDRDNADVDLDWDYHRERLPYQEGREGNQDVDMADLPRPRSGTPSRLRRDETSGVRGENLSPRERSGRRSRGEDRDSSRRRRDRDYVRSRSRSRDRGNWSPDRGRGRDRDRSYGHDDRDYSRRSSRSPRSRSKGAGGRESSYDELRSDRRRDRESTRYHAASILVRD
jgi:hypothetical protein